MSELVLDQINLVCGDVSASIAFYRRLGVEIPETRIWRTPTGPHHVSAAEQSSDRSILTSTPSSLLGSGISAGRIDQI